MGGGADDPVTRMTGSLAMLGRELESIKGAIGDAAARGDSSETPGMMQVIASELQQLAHAIAATSKPDVTVTVSPPEGFDQVLRRQTELVDQTLVPLVQAAARNLDDARALHEHVISLLELLRKVDLKLRESAD
jgi:hypothetical protein